MNAVQPQRGNVARWACPIADTRNRYAVRRPRTRMESDSVLIYSVARVPCTLPCASAALLPAASVAMMMKVRPVKGGDQCRPCPFAV